MPPKYRPRPAPSASPASTPPAPLPSPLPRPTGFPDPIPGVLPFGTVNFLAGASGSGKSRMLASWWVRWLEGKTICGHPTNRPTAMYWLFADRSWDEDGARIFDAYGLTAADVPHYNLAEDGGITEQDKHQSQAIKLLRRGIDTMAPVPGALVIVDPLSPLFIQGSPNDPRAVAWSLFAVRRLCLERQITIIATAYYAKQKIGQDDTYTRAIDRLSGSGVFAGYGHTVMYLEEPTPERLYYLFGWRPRHAPEQEFNFEMSEAGTFQPCTKLQNVSDQLQYDRPSQLFLLIPDEGIDTGELRVIAMEKFNISKTTFFEDLKVLKKRGVVLESEYGRVVKRKPS